MLLIIRRLIVIYFYDNLYLDFDRLIVFNFLNKPLQKILLLLGYSASSDLSTLRFYDLNNNLQAVDIARNCSGLQTVSLFISFFSSYVLVVKRKIGLEALVFILFGIILSYIANLFRMLIIVLVGIHYSIDQMLLIHHNIGWLIFTAWFFVFWQIYLFFSQESGDEL